MAQCPRCKEDMPLLSKICPVCGYVEEGDNKEQTAEEFVNALEEGLYHIKAIPEPTFVKSMGQLSFIMLPVIAIYLLLIAIISEAGLFWILFILFGILSLVAIIRKMTGNLGNDPFNRRFKEVKNVYEYNERLAKRNFGKSKEVSNLLGEISAQIADIEARRNAASRKNLLIWIIILAVCIGSASMGVFSINKSLNGTTEEESVAVVEGAAEQGTTSQGAATTSAAPEWKQALEAFKASSANDDYDDQDNRLKLVSAIVEAGEGKVAEDFFVGSCMGKMGDYDCAVKIVQFYAGKSDADAAKAFVGRCTKMRYNADRNKLQKLLK